MFPNKEEFLDLCKKDPEKLYIILFDIFETLLKTVENLELFDLTNFHGKYFLPFQLKFHSFPK